jgi:hypothetical protein
MEPRLERQENWVLLADMAALKQTEKAIYFCQSYEGVAEEEVYGWIPKSHIHSACPIFFGVISPLLITQWMSTKKDFKTLGEVRGRDITPERLALWGIGRSRVPEAPAPEPLVNMQSVELSRAQELYRQRVAQELEQARERTRQAALKWMQEQEIEAPLSFPERELLKRGQEEIRAQRQGARAYGQGSAGAEDFFDPPPALSRPVTTKPLRPGAHKPTTPIRIIKLDDE